MKKLACGTIFVVLVFVFLGGGVNLWLWVTAVSITEMDEIPILFYAIPSDVKTINYINEEIHWFNRHGTYNEEPLVFSGLVMLQLIFMGLFVATYRKCNVS